MANAFQAMLERFELTEKVLAVNADNATSNDTQTTKLHTLDNSFDKENRVRCFNHTIQLSAKSLLKPFNTALSWTSADNDMAAAFGEDINDQWIDQGDEGEGDESEEGDEGEGEVEEDVEDDNIDKLQELSEDARKELQEETAAVRETVTKVRTL